MHRSGEVGRLVAFEGAVRRQRTVQLDKLRWVFIAVALGGNLVTIYARHNDWKRGRR